jgi:autotransporter-associated beta strand protein
LTKSQDGTLVLNSQNFYTNVTNLNAGTLVLNGGINTILSGQQFTMGPGVTLDLKGNAQYVAAFYSPGTMPDTGGTVISSSGTGLLVVSSSLFAGRINGDNSLGMVSNNSFTIGAPQGYTGLTVRSGNTLSLQDEATILNTSGIELNTGGLSLNNNSNLQTQINNRISDTAPITLRTGAITLNALLHILANWAGLY